MPAMKRPREEVKSDEHWTDEDSDMAGFGQETRHLLEEDDSDEPEQIETFTNPGRLRLRPEVEVGTEYAGHKVSRKEAFGEFSDEDDQSRGNVMSGDESDGYDVEDDMKPVNEDVEDINRQYEELQREQQDILNSLKGQNDDDVKKGRAVKRQKELWDKTLQTRIILQEIIAKVNRLQDTSKERKQLASVANQTLHTLLDLQESFLNQNPAIVKANEDPFPDADAAAKTSGEGLDAAWERLDASYLRLVPFRDQTLDRWYRKSLVSSGTNFKAFNQSISQQVANAMKDPSKFIARMLIKSSVPGDEMNNASSQPETVTFDDSEFYQQMLREYLESSEALALSNEVRKQRSKKRKLVDRRASKGRKIRYTVHEPLVNFMTPEPMTLPPMADKLFASLFGNKPDGLEQGA